MDSIKKKDDLTTGPLFTKIVLFTIPIMLTGLLQLLFNAADLIVVGNYGSPNAVGAVGSTGSIINLLVNLFIGLSVGTAVTVSQAYGSKNEKAVHRIVHTSIATSLIGGLAIGVIGFFGSRFFLELMKTPLDVIDLATTYMEIYFLGMPASMLYNFSAAILKSVGDTKRPLYILTFSGVLNVVLNLIFVIVFKMDVAGVAWATTLSQYSSAILVLITLMKSEGCFKFELPKMRFYKKELLSLMRIGIPAGVQGMMFSLSNTIIQSTINGFGAPDAYGAAAVNGNAAASNIEGFVYTAMNSLHQTSLTFTGQNFGARKKKRITKTLLYCLTTVTAIGLVLGVSSYIFARPLLRIYAPKDLGAVEFGVLRMSFVALPYFLCGIMDVLSGMMRGLGVSFAPMIITLTSVCIFRVVWIYTVFPISGTPQMLYISYPISWALCIVLQLCYFFYVKKTVLDKFSDETSPA